ncbi:FAD-binding oxidoreductase [Candidatus Parcubacteria bacterium]|nr:MAG: FAD-binding oxidoreductase [Candidatus Parcubacteria bacterium]
MLTDRRRQALEELAIALGTERVFTAQEKLEKYTTSTLSSKKRKIIGVAFPLNAYEVAAIVKIAAKQRIPLYPISIGNNWGYGSRVPSDDSCIVLDLSKMNKIVHMDVDSGLITIEPGVTAKQLHDYLISNSAPYMPPVSIAGPNVSIVGNALDRGNGASAIIDRFSTIMHIEAVLADGSVYRSAFADESTTGGFFRWGVGPYIDGLFGESGFGIVTRMTISLAPIPERTEVFMIRIKRYEEFCKIIPLIQKAFFALGSTLTSIRIQSPTTTFSRLKEYSKADVLDNGVLDPASVTKALKLHSLDGWIILGTLQGERPVVEAAHTSLRRLFSQKIMFAHDKKIRWMEFFCRKLPAKIRQRFLFLIVLRSYLRVSSGMLPFKKPRLPFWKRGRLLSNVENNDYDRDIHAGLIFFSIVLPISRSYVEEAIRISEKICATHAIEPLISFNNFSDRCLRMSLPILFDKNDPEETRRAHACYRELFVKCKEKGIYVYRAPTSAMDMVVDMDHPFWQTAEKIKKALDPDNIMSPGRYSKYKAPHKEENV